MPRHAPAAGADRIATTTVEAHFGIVLRRDSSCCRDLNWRCDIPDSISLESMTSDLLASGFELRCRHAALRIFRHREGHELAWVVTTGRLQIRVAMQVEKRERQETAEGIFRQILAILPPPIAASSGADLRNCPTDLARCRHSPSTAGTA